MSNRKPPTKKKGTCTTKGRRSKFHVEGKDEEEDVNSDLANDAVARVSSSPSNNINDLPHYDWSGVFQNGRIKKQVQNVDSDLGVLPQKSLQLINTCSALLLRKVVQASLKLTTAVAADDDDDDPPFNSNARNDNNNKKKSGRKRKSAAAKSEPPQQQQQQQQVVLLSAQRILQGVQNDKSLHFLTETVEEVAKTDDTKLAKRKDKKQKASSSSLAVSTSSASQRKPPSSSKRRGTAAASETSRLGGGVSQQSLDQALEISSKQTKDEVDSTRIMLNDKIVMDEEDYD